MLMQLQKQAGSARKEILFCHFLERGREREIKKERERERMEEREGKRVEYTNI